jgi:pSer/pThr/pTyr-binding forkhead associated (FHA) protein
VTPIADSIQVEEALLGLKIAFLVLLYLFIWRIVRTASRDIRTPQDSFVISPSGAPGHRSVLPGRLVVVKSDVVPVGTQFDIDSTSLTVGRGPQNDVELEGDQFASARHARFDPRADGLWVQDVGSTNGTFVNGSRIGRPRKLATGDVVRVGATDLRYDG